MIGYLLVPFLSLVPDSLSAKEEVVPFLFCVKLADIISFSVFEVNPVGFRCWFWS